MTSVGERLLLGLSDHQSLGTSSQPWSPAEPQEDLAEEPPLEEPPPKPSKRLIILAECVWASEAERSLVLKELCERMAWDQLTQPFWVHHYYIRPVAEGGGADGGGADGCVQYKIHISTPHLEPGQLAVGPEQVGCPPPRVCSRL